MKLAIIGFGRMGSWLAEALAPHKCGTACGLAADNEVAVYDIDPSKTLNAANVTALKAVAELKDFKPQMLINAVNLQNIISAFESVVEYLQDDCVISDVASIKGELPRFYQRSGKRFVSIHPMFGPTFAKMSLLQGENAIIISESDKAAAGFFRAFFTKCGLNVSDCTFDEHDELMAYSLTLPFASSIVFAACLPVQQAGLPSQSEAVPGTTFARHRAIARGLLSEDDFLLAEVLFNPHSLAQLEKINSRLEFLKHIIRAKDYEEAQKFFAKLRENMR